MLLALVNDLGVYVADGLLALVRGRVLVRIRVRIRIVVFAFVVSVAGCVRAAVVERCPREGALHDGNLLRGCASNAKVVRVEPCELREHLGV